MIYIILILKFKRMSLSEEFKEERDYKEEKLQQQYEEQQTKSEWDPGRDTGMYHDLDIDILPDEKLPYISVLIPTYNRRRFLPLIVQNLRTMDYPKNLMEVCISDDGAESLFPDGFPYEERFLPIKVKYERITNRHLSIGEKRNRLVKMATHKIVANMDDDDLYLPTYLRYAVSVLLHYKVGIVHSPQMVFVYPKDNFKTTGIVCEAKRQGHEATQVFTKKHWKAMGGYTKNSRGEGAKMVDYHEKNCRCLDIRMCMMCVAHDDNTIPKDNFNKDELIVDCELHDGVKQLILSCLD
jgi:glycosyltransferase involved in cell wall biosynthesis